MAENEQLLPLFLFFSLFLYLIPYPSDSLPLPSPARLSTLRRFSRLGDRCSRAPTEDHACVASCSGHNACVHARMVRHATKREIIPRAACGPFVIRPYRRGGTNTRTKREGGGDTEGYESTSRTARLKNRRKRIVTCLSADVHRRVCVRDLRA